MCLFETISSIMVNMNTLSNQLPDDADINKSIQLQLFDK